MARAVFHIRRRVKVDVIAKIHRADVQRGHFHAPTGQRRAAFGNSHLRYAAGRGLNNQVRLRYHRGDGLFEIAGVGSQFPLRVAHVEMHDGGTGLHAG